MPGGWGWRARGADASILNRIVGIEATQSLVGSPGHRTGTVERREEEFRGLSAPFGPGAAECRSPGAGAVSALAPVHRGFSLKSPGTRTLGVTSLPAPRLAWGPGAAGVWGPLACLLAAAPSPSSAPEGAAGTLLTSVSLCFAVIRAKVVSEKEVDSGNDIYGNPIKRIQYEIKQIKVGVTVAGPLHGAERWEGWERDGVPQRRETTQRHPVFSRCLWVPGQRPAVRGVGTRGLKPQVDGWQVAWTGTVPSAGFVQRCVLFVSVGDDSGAQPRVQSPSPPQVCGTFLSVPALCGVQRQ